jgi:uncharacterized protein
MLTRPFWDNISNMNFEAAKEYIINRLIHELSPKLYYHGLHHTLDVYYSTKQLAAFEHVSDEDLLLLETAALFHDAVSLNNMSTMNLLL